MEEKNERQGDYCQGRQHAHPEGFRTPGRLALHLHSRFAGQNSLAECLLAVFLRVDSVLVQGSLGPLLRLAQIGLDAGKGMVELTVRIVQNPVEGYIGRSHGLFMQFREAGGELFTGRFTNFANASLNLDELLVLFDELISKLTQEEIRAPLGTDGVELTMVKHLLEIVCIRLKDSKQMLAAFDGIQLFDPFEGEHLSNIVAILIVINLGAVENELMPRPFRRTRCLELPNDHATIRNVIFKARFVDVEGLAFNLGRNDKLKQADSVESLYPVFPEGFGLRSVFENNLK